MLYCVKNGDTLKLKSAPVCISAKELAILKLLYNIN